MTDPGCYSVPTMRLAPTSFNVLRSLFLFSSLLLCGACGDGGPGDLRGGSIGGSTENGGGSGGEDGTNGGAPGAGGHGAGGSSGSGASKGSGATGGADIDGLGGNVSGGSSAGGSLADGGASGGSPSGGGGGGTATGGAGGVSEVPWPLINGVQWADTEGNPIQAHGGGMLKIGHDYYWFGENRNPDGTFYAVSAYRSRDLRRWEHVNDVLTMESDSGLDPANVERPKVVYNEATQKYVMWMHWENGMDYGEARAAVASSDTVTGDYAYHGSFRPFQDSGVIDHDKPGYMSRDCTLFVDDDGTGYFLSASNENYDLHLYRLSEDYLSIESLEAVLFEGEHREAPALFKRGDTYFLITSGSTGWSPNQAKYASSSSLTSGWSELRNVANGNTFYSQSTYVQEVQGSEGTGYLYMGDRWAGAWDGRVNDSSYLWQPISFPSETSLSMDWYNTLQIDTEAGTVSGSIDSFVLLNEGSGLALSVEGDENENSADLVQLEPGEAQSWRLNYDGAGHFRITNDSSDKVVDVPDESEEAGVDLHLWDDNGGDHQAWRLMDRGEGEYRIVNKKSGHSLGVADGSTEVGAAIQQQSERQGDEQVWRIVIAE